MEGVVFAGSFILGLVLVYLDERRDDIRRKDSLGLHTKFPTRKKTKLDKILE